MGCLRDLLQAGLAGDTGAASQRSGNGVEKERPSVRVRRTRERDLTAYSVVDHDDLLEERPPENDPLGHVAEHEVDPDERRVPRDPESRDDDEGGVDRDGARGGRGRDPERIDDGEAKALGEASVDAVAPVRGVDEGTRGRSAEGRLAIARARGSSTFRLGP